MNHVGGSVFERRTEAPYNDLSIVTQAARTLLSPRTCLAVNRVPEGVSTAVYRVEVEEGTLYLRVLPEVDASFAPEAEAHGRLRALGARAPEVIAFEPYNALLQRSVMLTAAIPGRAIGYGDRPAAVEEILRDAGRDLARINGIAVQGYGWITRDEHTAGLCAEHSTAPLWFRAHFEAPLRALHDSGWFAPREVERLLEALDVACTRFQNEAAVLAHGDFDPTHIFFDDGGYTGIIDFGEIRGAHRLYDLGHFAIESGDLLLPLLAGYGEIAPIPDALHEDLQLTGVLIAARRLGNCAVRNRAPHPPDLDFIVRALPRFATE